MESPILAASTTIISRTASMIKSLHTLSSKYEKAQNTARQLADRLELFQQKVVELNSDIKEANHISQAAESSIRVSLSSSEEVLDVVEKHVSNFNHKSKIRLKLGKIKSLWDNAAIVECDRRLSLHIQMLYQYIQLVKLNNEALQNEMMETQIFILVYRDSTGGSVPAATSFDGSSTTVNAATQLTSDESIPRPYNDMAPTEATSSADLVERMAHKHPRIIEQMLSSDPNIRLPADSIMLAIRENDVEFAKLLLDYGASVNGLVDGITPLCAALICHLLEDESDDMVDLLLSRGADVDEVLPEFVLRHHCLQDWVNTEPLDGASHEGIPTYCQVCAQERTPSSTGYYTFAGYKAYNVAPIHLAARFRCRPGPLKAILACRPKVDVGYSFKLSKLPQDIADSMKFAREKHTPLGAGSISALHDSKVMQVPILARAGASLAVQDTKGLTPLAWAILAPDLKKATALLQAGSSLQNTGPGMDAITIWFQSISRPLIETDPVLDSRLLMLELLLNAGADTSAFVQTLTQNWPIGTRVEFEASMIKTVPGKPNFWEQCNELIKIAWETPPAVRRTAFLKTSEERNMRLPDS